MHCKIWKILLGTALVSAVLPVEALTLVEAGRGRTKIVLPPEPYPVEKLAARELQIFLRRASGAELAIVSAPQPGKNLILIGRASGVAGLKRNTSLLRSTADSLILAGGDDANSLQYSETACGTLFAVYEFLEKELNLLWLWPGEDYGVVVRPKTTIKTGEYKIHLTPALENVRIRKYPLEWGRRAARIHSTPVYFEGPAGHAFTQWAKLYGKEHPEFFAFSKGKRLNRKNAPMCVANPAFHDEIVRRWREASLKEPQRHYDINCCENDTKGICECPLCKAWDPAGSTPGDVSERYAKFYAAVYEKAAKYDPSVRVYGYAYSNYLHAPKTIKLPPNVMISIVPSPLQPFDPASRELVLEKMIGAWKKSGAALSYRPNLLSGYAMPEEISSDFYDEFQAVRAARMVNVDIDGPNVSFATQGPFLYVLQRLMIHPDAKLADLKKEYYSGFGPAAKEVEAYWEYWTSYALRNADRFHAVPKKYNPLRYSMHFGFHYAFYAHRLFPPDAFVPAEKLLKAALEAAKNSPDDLKRVQFLMAGLQHAKLCADTCAVFADKTSSTEARMAALKEVDAFRKTSLPPWASWIKQFKLNGMNEQVAWTFSGFDPKTMMELPIEWKLCLDPKDEGEKRGFAQSRFDDSAWRTIRTDRLLEFQGISPGYLNAWYRLSLMIPEQFRGKKTILHFGAIDEGCRLYINGKPAGKYDFNGADFPDSWKQPMEFDITEFVPADGRITIALKVINEQGRGGLWRPSQLRFFDRESQEYRVNVKTLPPEHRSAQTFGKRIRYQEDFIRLLGGDRKSFGKIYLNTLKYCAGRNFIVRVTYRSAGKRLPEFVLVEKDLAKKQKFGSTRINLPPTAEWKTVEQTISLSMNTERIDLAVILNMPGECYFDLKEMSFTLGELRKPQKNKK